MSAVADSREIVLGRIRGACGGDGKAAANGEAVAGGYETIPRDYVRRGGMTAAKRFERMAERLREYDAEVVECVPEEVAATIAAQLKASGRRRFVVPAGLTAGWLAEGFEWEIDHGMEASEIEECEGVVTECFCGVAESGTVVLHHSASEGRRVITLLPDWHLCVLRESQIVETLPEYFAKAGNNGTREAGNEKAPVAPRLVTWISGPSATADIEMTRIKGVHGPRFLNVVIVRDQADAG